MFWKKFAVAVLASLFVVAAVPVRSQVVQSASRGSLPLTTGAGVSDFLLDWGHSRKEMGVTAWADWRLRGLPGLASGFGLEAEGRSIFFNEPAVVQGHRMDTGEGGPIYQWRRYDRVRPYAKYLIGFGSIDFPPLPGGHATYTHDTRTILAPGGGADIHLWNGFYVRADYEYQFWLHIFGPNDLNPNGVTLGAVYDFGRHGRE
jgi:hypothetical protein